MRLTASSRFLRKAKKLREPQASMLRAALRRFAADPHDPLLRTHKLSGGLAAYWSFSVDEDLRVLFRWEGEEAFLVNLGSHDRCCASLARLERSRLREWVCLAPNLEGLFGR